MGMTMDMEIRKAALDRALTRLKFREGHGDSAELLREASEIEKYIREGYKRDEPVTPAPKTRFPVEPVHDHKVKVLIKPGTDQERLVEASVSVDEDGGTYIFLRDEAYGRELSDDLRHAFSTKFTLRDYSA